MRIPKVIYNKSYNRWKDEKSWAAYNEERGTIIELENLYDVLKWAEKNGMELYEDHIIRQYEEVKWFLNSEDIFQNRTFENGTKHYDFMKIDKNNYEAMIMWFELNGFRVY